MVLHSRLPCTGIECTEASEARSLPFALQDHSRAFTKPVWGNHAAATPYSNHEESMQGFSQLQLSSITL